MAFDDFADMKAARWLLTMTNLSCRLEHGEQALIFFAARRMLLISIDAVLNARLLLRVAILITFIIILPFYRVRGRSAVRGFARCPRYR